MPSTIPSLPASPRGEVRGSSGTGRRRIGTLLLLGLLPSILGGCGGDEPQRVVRPGELALPADEPPPLGVDPLLQRLDLQALVELQQARDGTALVTHLRDPDPLVRERAARALASVQDTGAVLALAAALGDPEEGVRVAAAFALARTRGPEVPGLLLAELGRGGEGADGMSRALRARLMEGVGEAGEVEHMEALAALEVQASDLEAWFLSLGRFANRGVTSPAGLSVLEEGLSLPAPALRAAAAYYLSRHPDPSSWAPLVPRARGLLESLLPWEPAGARLLVGFANRADPADVPLFLRWLRESGDWRIRVAAAQALAASGQVSEGRAALVEALDDPSEHVALAAAVGLSALPQTDPATQAALTERLAEEALAPRLVEPLLQARIRGGAAQEVLGWYDALTPDRVEERAGALRALAIIPGGAALERLATAARDPSPLVARAAAAALASRWEVEEETGPPQDAVREMYREAFASTATREDPALRAIGLRTLAGSGFASRETLDLLLEQWDVLDPLRDARTLMAILDGVGASEHPGRGALLDRVALGSSPVLRERAAELLEPVGGLPPEARALPLGIPRPGVDWETLQALGDRPRLVLETDRGRIVAILAPGEAPLTVGAMARLANEGRYDDTPFHRVVPNFVAQGGDVARGDGSGGPGYRLRTELTRIPFLRGTLGMASSGKDTEGSQFFITHTPQPHLDSGYTAFGWVVEGMDVVDLLQVGDRIHTARVVAATS
jgi:cyclophilin family peptidyl-prolyl cis-trans isomerase/HEAT repeat protein